MSQVAKKARPPPTKMMNVRIMIVTSRLIANFLI